MAAPGTGAPPGVQQQEAHQDGRPGAFPPNFQPPANMPNINFSAPVIRLGTAQNTRSDLLGGRDDRGGRRAGLGSGAADSRGPDRDRIQQVQPQTKEEIVRTIFVGGITEGTGGDDGIERIMRAAGGLRRWVRATDADDRPCKFGFAEYEDPESLSTAIEVLKDVEVPVKRQTPKEKTAEEEDEVEVEKSKLMVRQNSNAASMTNIARLSQTKIRAATSTSGRNNKAVSTLILFKCVWIMLKKHFRRCLGTSPTPQCLPREMNYQTSIQTAILQWPMVAMAPTAM